MKTPRSKEFKAMTGDASPLPVPAAEASLSTLLSHRGLLSRAWGWLRSRNVARSSTRRLRVAETVSLGEKRFVAVVQVDGRHFLVAGGPTNIALLAQLDANDVFEEVLKKTLTAPTKQVAKRKRPASKAKQAQVNRTTSLEDVAISPASKPPVKRASKENAFGQRPASAPSTTHSNGTGNFDHLLQKTISEGRQPGNQPSNHAKSTAQQRGYYA